ncbi:MAG TPA: PqiC family protein [Gemmatimonadales bacterium]
MRKWPTSLLWGLSSLWATACGLGPKADPSNFFILTPAPQAQHSSRGCSPSSTTLAVGVGPIQLPAYLDRQELVSRSKANRLDVSENNRWAEPLTDNLAQILAQNLSALLGIDKVSLYPWTSDLRPAYQVEIEVLGFEPDSARSAELTARWILRDVPTRAILSDKTSELTEPLRGPSTEESVAALSELLGRFSCGIAEALREIP